MSKKILNLNVIFFAVLFLLSGCSIPFLSNKPNAENKPPLINLNDSNTENINNEASKTIYEKLAAQSKIKKFNSYDEVQAFLEKAGNNNSSYYFNGGLSNSSSRSFSIEPMMEDSLGFSNPISSLGAETQKVAMPSSAGASDDYSKTNVQVEGVDEADIIKTDGNYIYAVKNNFIFIIKAYPGTEARIVTSIKLESSPQDIFINGNSLIIFGYDNKISSLDVYKKFKRRSSYTFFKVFDISDKKAPKQVRNLDFEGNYFNSRMIGDYVYFITSNPQYYIQDEMPIPRILENGIELSTDKTAVKCNCPDIYYFDIPYDSYNFTSITAINVKDNNETVTGDVYMLSGSQNLFASENNIYITYTKYVSEEELMLNIIKEIIYPRLSDKSKEKIDKIEKTDNDVLSNSEKTIKIMQIIKQYATSLNEEEVNNMEKIMKEKVKEKYKSISKELEKTVIQKISINKNKLEYKTVGEVTGKVLNQFSMDESDGNFRIATTKNRAWSSFIEEEDETDSYSNLYVLNPDLKVIGSLENLAKGERIYSVRFMQNRAYMVTFKQTDPLFVIDLSSPTSPKVLGELKIPGFSNYLHPYDQNTLIGFGKDTSTNEWGGVTTKGLKLTLFDVSDVSKPKEINTYVLGDMGSDSEALRDHKAFLFSKDKNLLVVPVIIRESKTNNSWGEVTFNGAAVFKVDKTGFELKGKIDHNKQISTGNLNSNNSSAKIIVSPDYNNYVKRSLYIKDTLYTYSYNYLKLNKLDNLETIKNIPMESSSDFQIINE